MTSGQIIWEIGIGVFLAVLAATLGPLLKRAWAWKNRPTPLSPKDKGKLTEHIALQEQALERLNHFSSHPKDLFLYLYQVLIAALLFLVLAVFVYLFVPLPRTQVFLLSIVLLSIAGTFCVTGFVEASRMSDRQIDIYKENLKKGIDEAKKRLNTP